MICIQTVKRFCKDPIEWIENYLEAVNDTTQTWDCHHRNEILLNVSAKKLREMGLYYRVPACDLIFLTHRDHNILHHRGKKRPKEFSEKMSELMTGERNHQYGKHLSEETKQKISKSMEGKNLKHYISYEDLYELYTIQGLSQYQIAKKYRCGQASIWNLIKKYGIKKCEK